MKNTTVSDDDIEMSFFTRSNIRDWGVAQKILNLFFLEFQEIAPELVDSGQGLRAISLREYDYLSLDWANNDNVTFYRTDNYRSQLAMLLGNLKSGHKLMSLWVERNYFKLESNIRKFIKLGNQIHEVLKPDYGFIHESKSKLELATIQHPNYGKTILPINLDKGIPGIYWANYFGENYVESIGRDKLKSSPEAQIVELSNGGMLLLIGDSPANISSEYYRSAAKVRFHLGNIFYPSSGDGPIE
jgi:hypothetical protein